MKHCSLEVPTNMLINHNTTKKYMFTSNIHAIYFTFLT